MHSNTASFSLEVKEKVAEFVPIVPEVLPSPIVASGAVVSILTWRAAEALEVLFAASVAVAVIWCVPSASALASGTISSYVLSPFASAFPPFATVSPSRALLAPSPS